MLRWDKVSRPWPMAPPPQSLRLMSSWPAATTRNRAGPYVTVPKAPNSIWKQIYFDLLNYSGSPICSLSCKTKFLVLSSFRKCLIYLFKWFWKRVSLTYVDVHTKGSTWRVAHVLGREKFNNSSIERPRISCYFLSLSSIRSSLALQLKLGFALIPSTKYHVNDNRRGFLDYYF